MSTFLELVINTRLEAGVPGATPSTVLNQTGESRRVVDWVRRAWSDIQLESSQWQWMTGQFQFVTEAGKDAYTESEAGITAPGAVSRFSHWNPRTVRIHLSGFQDQRGLEYIDYEAFRSIYYNGPRVPGWPTVVSVSPSKQLLLGHPPNDLYTVTGEYQKSPQILSGDADIPEMPAQFHDLIMYWALAKYARFESAPEVYQDAMANYKRLMSALRVHQLPAFMGAETLV